MLSIKDTQHKQHSAIHTEYHYAQCRVLFNIVLNVIMMSVVNFIVFKFSQAYIKFFKNSKDSKSVFIFLALVVVELLAIL
jgi:hypothetical protein